MRLDRGRANSSVLADERCALVMALDLVARLGRVRHFQGLSADALRAIVDAGQVVRFPAGATIFAEDEPCAGMFVLLSGRVNLCKLGPNGHEQIISVIEPVIMFNEVAVLDGGPNPVMALAVDDCLTWNISYTAFHSIIRQYPAVGLGLLPVLAARNRSLIARYEDMSYLSILARTAKMLLLWSDNGRRPIDRKEHSLDEMAAHIGTVREPVSRAIRTLRESGIITCTRAQIVVSQPEALARQAHVELLKGRS